MDIMVDLETLGNGPTSAVVQIGAVAFDMNSGGAVAEFLSNIDPQSEIDEGFQVDGSTISWWMEQAKKGRCSWASAQRKSQEVWVHFASWCKTYSSENNRYWSHSTFDAPIIFYHYNKLPLAAPPWRYNQWLDLRTVSVLARGLMSIPNQNRPAGRHDALVDARYQVQWLYRCWKEL